MLHLITSMNGGYRERGQAYLDSLNRNCNEDINLVLFNVDCGHHDKAGRMTQIDVKTEDFRGYCPKSKYIMQAGQWLDFFGCDKDDTVIFTDADMVMQRPFSDGEISLLLSDSRCFMAINKSQDQTMEDEMQHLHVLDADLVERHFPMYRYYCMHNSGVICAKRYQWERVFSLYEALYPFLFRCFDHYAAVQWLICYCFGLLYGKIVRMPETIHTHSHHGIKDGVEHKDGLWLCRGTPIVFAHKLKKK